MRFATVGFLVAVAAVGCNKIKPNADIGDGATPTEFKEATLAEARKGFTTKLPPPAAAHRAPPETPPRGVFDLVRYESPVGRLAAYVTPDPKDGGKHPAIVWVSGDDCNSIESMWGRRPAGDDRSAAQYREAGVVLMVPSLRGGNDNPGRREVFLGEIDDVIAAAAYLRALPYVDPARVYLGGTSTGGTVAFLAAETSDTFRAAFVFSPLEVSGDPPEVAGFNTRDAKEVEIRSPAKWLGSIRTPTLVIEGAHINAEHMARMARSNTNPKVTFVTVRGGSQYSILAPLNRVLARKIVADTGPTCAIALTDDEAAAALRP